MRAVVAFLALNVILGLFVYVVGSFAMGFDLMVPDGVVSVLLAFGCMAEMVVAGLTIMPPLLRWATLQ